MPLPRMTIRRGMAVIAIIAPLLALARCPFAFGLFIRPALVALFIALSVRRRRFDLIAWLIIAYPGLFLLILHLQRWLIRIGLARRSSPLFEGLIGLSDTGGCLCLLAYVACVSIVAAKRARDQMLRPAAKRVVFLMPPAWVGLLAFAIWDPFGVLGYFFRF
jgi:hypothetical protein